MKIRVKLMGILRTGEAAPDCLEISEGATIRSALAALNLPDDAVHACTVNGKLIRDRDQPLCEGDELTVLPPMVGG